DGLIVRTFGLENREGALVEGAEDGMVDQHVAAGHSQVKFDYRRTAGGNQRGLHVLLFVHAALIANPVEDRADDMEAADEVGAAIAHKQADRFAPLGLERVSPNERAL